MKGGFFVSLDDALFARAAAALVDLGATQFVDVVGEGTVQYADSEGRLFTMFEKVPLGTEWEVHEGPFTAAPGVRLPDMQAVTACPFECRWDDLTAQLAHTIAIASIAPTWVLDGNGVVWDAAAVDAQKICL